MPLAFPCSLIYSFFFVCFWKVSFSIWNPSRWLHWFHGLAFKLISSSLKVSCIASMILWLSDWDIFSCSNWTFLPFHSSASQKFTSVWFSEFWSKSPLKFHIPHKIFGIPLVLNSVQLPAIFCTPGFTL